jgi:hypothetical protein
MSCRNRQRDLRVRILRRTFQQNKEDATGDRRERRLIIVTVQRILIKLSRYRLGQAFRAPGGCASQNIYIIGI